MPDIPVTELPNIGTTLAHRLARIDIRTRADLEKVGSVSAYRLLCEIEQRRLPVCYNLYSLEAALRDHDWRLLSKEDKQGLKEKV